MKPVVDCASCPLGMVSGVGEGMFCPFIVRDYREGEVLYHKGEPATYGWFIRAGEVELGSVERKGPGQFIGLETLVRDQYDTTSRSATATRLCGATREGLLQWLGPESPRLRLILSDVLQRPAQTKGRPIMRQKITCPDTAHLEDIEFYEDPVDGKILGVHTCSRFEPEDQVDCEFLCVHRINKRLGAADAPAEAGYTPRQGPAEAGTGDSAQRGK